jgi:hypothetical protein
MRFPTSVFSSNISHWTLIHILKYFCKRMRILWGNALLYETGTLGEMIDEKKRGEHSREILPLREPQFRSKLCCEENFSQQSCENLATFASLSVPSVPYFRESVKKVIFALTLGEKRGRVKGG